MSPAFDEDKLTRDLKAAQVTAALDALWRIGQDIGGRAQRLAPVEEGNLRASMAVVLLVDGARFDSLAAAQAAARAKALAGGDVTADVEVSFNEVYAARQHEELDWNHPLGGQAKYLEQPFKELEPRFRRILELAVEAAGIRERLSGG